MSKPEAKAKSGPPKTCDLDEILDLMDGGPGHALFKRKNGQWVVIAVTPLSRKQKQRKAEAMTDTLYERLTATEGGSKSLIGIEWNTNPDGPEAAALLRVMLAGLFVACDELNDREIGADPAMSDAIAAARAAGVPET